MKPRFLIVSILIFWCLTGQEAGARPLPAEPQTPPAGMTLAQALARVFARNPELSVSELEIEAASARVLQATQRPNPEIRAESENLSTPWIGSGLFRLTENTLEISQRVELGGKRNLRVLAAEKEVAVASYRLEVKKIELIAATSQAFADVLAEQQRLANQQDLSRLTRQSHDIVVERVSAGKVSPVEQTRSGVALASARIEEEKRRSALTAAKARLAGLWGGSDDDVDAVEGAFQIPASTSASAPCTENNPELKMAAATVDSRSAALSYEIASKKPDLTFHAGFRRLNPERQQVWVGGVSIPIPVFDKRQGAIAEARIRVDQSRAEQTAAERRLRASLIQARHDLEIARVEATTLTESALPAAREAEAAIEEGYRLGKFDFLNVLDAQRTYAELQGRYIESVASGLKASIEIDRVAPCDESAVSTNPAKRK